jgi:hypothetical protein
MAKRSRTRRKAPKATSKSTITTAQAINNLEEFLGGEGILVYIQDSLIGPWDVMPIFRLLSEIGKTKRLNLILQSPGGYADDAYKIANLIHEFCEYLTVIVPLKAKSAATILSLGGDQILMSALSELGPCDPMIRVDASIVTPTGLPIKPPAEEETEGGDQERKKRQINALALRDFLEAAGILQTDGQGQVRGYDCEKLLPFCEKGVLNPWLLGDFERSFKQPYQFAENLLTRYMFKSASDALTQASEIARKLTEGYYYHDYPISRREAQELGLTVQDMGDDLQKRVGELMAAYDVMKQEQKLRTIIETSRSYQIFKWAD